MPQLGRKNTKYGSHSGMDKALVGSVECPIDPLTAAPHVVSFAVCVLDPPLGGGLIV